MRQIKFRAWDVDNKQFVFLVIIHHSAIPKIVPSYKGNFDEWQQFIDLKDRYGIEIYEGDIVEHKSRYLHVAGRFEVKYDTEKHGRAKGDFAAFCLHSVGEWDPRYKGDKGWGGVVGSQGHLVKELEIIGNIYENPELL